MTAPRARCRKKETPQAMHAARSYQGVEARLDMRTTRYGPAIAVDVEDAVRHVDVGGELRVEAITAEDRQPVNEGKGHDLHAHLEATMGSNVSPDRWVVEQARCLVDQLFVASDHDATFDEEVPPLKTKGRGEIRLGLSDELFSASTLQLHLRGDSQPRIRIGGEPRLDTREIADCDADRAHIGHENVALVPSDGGAAEHVGVRRHSSNSVRFVVCFN